MGSQNLARPSTKLAPSLQRTPATSPRQLDLVLDDVRPRGMIAPERQAALRALERLLLEASGLTMEAGDDHA
jgi:hypothetical protein